MTILSFTDIGLVLLVLVIGASTIFAREAFDAVIAFVVYGLLLAIVWVRLSAIDVALTEAAIGGGMTGTLLLGAAARLRSAEPDSTRIGLPVRLAAAFFCALVAACLASGAAAPAQRHPHTRADGDGKPGPYRARESGRRRSVRLSCARHHARESSPAARLAWRVVAGAELCVERDTRSACLRTAKQHADIPRSTPAACGNNSGIVYVLGWSQRPRRRLSRRHNSRCDVAPRHHRADCRPHLQSDNPGCGSDSSLDRSCSLPSDSPDSYWPMPFLLTRRAMPNR